MESMLATVGNFIQSYETAIKWSQWSNGLKCVNKIKRQNQQKLYDWERWRRLESERNVEVWIVVTIHFMLLRQTTEAHIKKWLKLQKIWIGYAQSTIRLDVTMQPKCTNDV